MGDAVHLFWALHQSPSDKSQGSWGDVKEFLCVQAEAMDGVATNLEKRSTEYPRKIALFMPLPLPSSAVTAGYSFSRLIAVELVRPRFEFGR